MSSHHAQRSQVPLASDEGMVYCYYHAPGRRNASGQTRAHKKPLKLPALVDREAVQFALGQVLDAMLSSRVNSRTAGQLLFGLQIAADSFRRAGRSPQPNKRGAKASQEPKQKAPDESALPDALRLAT